jgi:hypothetical protein
MFEIFMISILLLICPFSIVGYNSSCSGPIQTNQRYNVNIYSAADVGLPYDPPVNESLSDAICCDITYRNFAEPNGFYKFPEIHLFSKVLMSCNS